MDLRTNCEHRVPVIYDNNHFRSMIDSIDDYAIFMVDLDGNVSSWNQGAKYLTGYSEEEAIGCPFLSLYTPGNWQATQLTEELDVARRAGRYENIGLRKRKDGTIYSAQVVVRRVDDEEGRTVGYATVIRDVTEHMEAEQALKESEAKFRTITEAMPQMVWSTLPDGYHDYYNRQWYQFTGVPVGSTDGDGWNGMFHPDDRARAWEKWQHCLTTGEPYEIEYRVRHHSGEYRWTLGRALPIRDDDGMIVRWMGTCTEIHAQKHAEAALKEASERKDEFLAMLAHELRNPLAPLYNGTVLIRQSIGKDSQLLGVLDVMERQVKHMSLLINDLLDVARISRGKMNLRKHACDLKKIVQQTAEDSRARFDDAGIELVVDCSDESMWLQGDRIRIAQVVGNLLHNASKFTDAGGVVHVTTRRISSNADQAIVVVRDTGAGIGPRLLSRLFEPFVQADQDLARAEGGLGLGLAVVKGLMELHGGTVEAHSDGVGQGTTFTLRFPLDVTIKTPPPTDQTIANVVEPEMKLRIVVVEDNRDMLETLGALLQSQGHEVITASDGPAGLSAITSSQPDLVICDIGLPGGLDGYALACSVRAQQSSKNPRIVLIALSGYGQENDRQKSKDSGFDVHLLKPVDFDELKAILTRVNAKVAHY